MIVKRVDPVKPIFDVFVGHGWENRVRVSVKFHKKENDISVVDSSFRVPDTLKEAIKKQFNKIKRGES